MNGKSIKILALGAIFSLCFSVSLCLYSVNADVHMPHHNQMMNVGQHLTMAHTFNVFVLPIATILGLVLIWMLVSKDIFPDNLLNIGYVFESYVEKNKFRFRYATFSPRSPPKY